MKNNDNNQHAFIHMHTLKKKLQKYITASHFSVYQFHLAKMIPYTPI